ncbi:hypothetical protein ACFL16_00875 [Patescibacteria group bacterium]
MIQSGIKVVWTEEAGKSRFIAYLQKRYGKGPFVVESVTDDGSNLYLMNNCGLLSHQSTGFCPIPFRSSLVDMI